MAPQGPGYARLRRIRSGAIRDAQDGTWSGPGESVIGDCWRTLVITNAGGTWDGTFTGTTTWSLSEPDHVHMIDSTHIGTGDYDGLRLVSLTEGTDYPWTITGRIEPAD